MVRERIKKIEKIGEKCKKMSLKIEGKVNLKGYERRIIKEDKEILKRCEKIGIKVIIIEKKGWKKEKEMFEENRSENVEKCEVWIDLNVEIEEKIRVKELKGRN